MKPKKIEMAVGLFVVVGMFLIATMIIRFGSEDYFAYKDAINFSVHFNFADGILEKAPVRYAGVDVGEVKSLRLTDNPKQRVIVDLIIKKGVNVREKDKFMINSLGLMTELYVEIIPGDPTANLVDQGALLPGTDPVALQEVINSAKKVLEELEKGVQIFSEDETKENIKYTLRNMRKLSEDIKDVSGNLEEGIGIMRNLFVNNEENITISISEFKDNIKGMRKSVEAMERIFARVERGEGLIGKLVMDEKTSTVFSENIEKVKILLDDLHDISMTMKEGEGTIGMFLNDEEVSEKLKKLIIEIEKNPWKLLRKK